MASTLEPAPAAPSSDDLRALHGRLAERLRAPSKPDTFFQTFTAEVVGVLRGAGGAVWLVDGDRLLPVAVTKPVAADLPRWEQAAREVLAVGAGTTVRGEPNGRGPALLYPLLLGTTTRGVVLVVLPEAASKALQGTVQRALVPLCDYAAEYLYRFDRSAAAAQAGLAPSAASTTAGGDDVARFALAVHASLDADRTAAAVVNETRRLIGCDRVSVCYVRGRRASAAAFSGQDQFDRRASLVRRLEALATAVAAVGETLVVPHVDEPAAPQIERALQPYLDDSQARRLMVVPLYAAGDGSSGEGSAGEPTAVLAVEQLGGATATSDWPARLAPLLPHASAALANARRYDAAPLRGVSRRLESIVGATSARKLPTTTLIVGAAGALVAALALVPYPFAVEAPGTLQPVVRRDVFAAADGTIDRVLVRTGDRVAPGDVLFELRNSELELAEADLIKQMNENEQELLNAQRAYNEGNRTLTQAEQTRLLGQIAVFEQRRESLRRQGALFTEKREQLKVRSPLAGQVATWNVEELLTQRPVRRGQTLVGLIDPDGAWEIEVRVPEDRFGHVASASRRSDAPLGLTFVSAADPNRHHRGTVREMHLAAEPRGEEGNVVSLRADFDKRQLAQLQAGADVRVRIDCGRRSLGYVLLGDAWAFVQTRVLFRL